MSITFGGRSGDAISKAAPAPGKAGEADAAHLVRLDANAMRLWLDIAERDSLRERMERLADRLDDPKLLDHPRWGEAWNRLARMEGDMAFLVKRIADEKRCVERDYNALTEGGKRFVREKWRIPDGVEVVDAVTSDAESGVLMPMTEVPF